MLPPSSPSCSLYCSEDADEITDGTILPPPPSSSDASDSPISQLFISEHHHRPLPDYLPRLRSGDVDSAARGNAIAWIRKVHGFFRFRPVTGYLAVSYLDRFLSCNTLPRESGGWPWQLLAVACLSVAAKMEETLVPPLLDLQVMSSVSEFLFEPRTIRRMELLLMTALQWRMRAVTPFDFLLHHLLVVGGGSCLVSRASELVLCTLPEVEFLGCLPSATAAAAIICALEDIGDLGSDNVDMSIFYDADGKEAIEGCCHLMAKHLIQTYQSTWQLPRWKVKEDESVASQPLPHSPVAVLDAAACRSYESTMASESTTVDIEPPSKRLRLETFECTDNKKDKNA